MFRRALRCMAEQTARNESTYINFKKPTNKSFLQRMGWTSYQNALMAPVYETVIPIAISGLAAMGMWGIYVNQKYETVKLAYNKK
mmetsp:Transcript_33055/g.59188  ORF Transcript_33055/g.59188 Transcript_33055/m.59188 type:complete len:85 (-) Transcript_33055:443-697(-)